MQALDESGINSIEQALPNHALKSLLSAWQSVLASSKLSSVRRRRTSPCGGPPSASDMLHKANWSKRGRGEDHCPWPLLKRSARRPLWCSIGDLLLSSVLIIRRLKSTDQVNRAYCWYLEALSLRHCKPASCADLHISARQDAEIIQPPNRRLATSLTILSIDQPRLGLESLGQAQNAFMSSTLEVTIASCKATNSPSRHNPASGLRPTQNEFTTDGAKLLIIIHITSGAKDYQFSENICT